MRKDGVHVAGLRLMVGRLWVAEDGQGMSEYALILALIAVVAIAALTKLGGGVESILGEICQALGCAS